MNAPIMPLATAVWLIDNTALTFQQVADFCGLHVLEVQAIADGQSAVGIKGADPVALGQLTQDELDRCTKNPDTTLKKSLTHVDSTKYKKVKPKSNVKKQDKLGAVLWLLQTYPDASDGEIRKIVSTTALIIKSLRDGSHPLFSELKPVSPMKLDLCSQLDLDKLPKTIRA